MAGASETVGPTRLRDRERERDGRGSEPPGPTVPSTVGRGRDGVGSGGSRIKRVGIRNFLGLV
jgi:hypothetical protein